MAIEITVERNEHMGGRWESGKVRIKCYADSEGISISLQSFPDSHVEFIHAFVEAFLTQVRKSLHLNQIKQLSIDILEYEVSNIDSTIYVFKLLGKNAADEFLIRTDNGANFF